MEILKGYITIDWDDEKLFWDEEDTEVGYLDDLDGDEEGWIADENGAMLKCVYLENSNWKNQYFESFDKVALQVVKCLDVLDEQSNWVSSTKGTGYHDYLVKDVATGEEYTMTTSQWTHDQKIRLI